MNCCNSCCEVKLGDCYQCSHSRYASIPCLHLVRRKWLLRIAMRYVCSYVGPSKRFVQFILRVSKFQLRTGMLRLYWWRALCGLSVRILSVWRWFCLKILLFWLLQVLDFSGQRNSGQRATFSYIIFNVCCAVNQCCKSQRWQSYKDWHPLCSSTNDFG